MVFISYEKCFPFFHGEWLQQNTPNPCSQIIKKQKCFYVFANRSIYLPSEWPNIFFINYFVSLTLTPSSENYNLHGKLQLHTHAIQPICAPDIQVAIAVPAFPIELIAMLSNQQALCWPLIQTKVFATNQYRTTLSNMFRQMWSSISPHFKYFLYILSLQVHYSISTPSTGYGVSRISQAIQY